MYLSTFFPLYIISRASSTFGDIAFNIFIVTVIFKSTGSPTQTAAVLALGAVPHVLIGKYVSKHIDTWNPRTITVLSDVYRFIVLLIFSFSPCIESFYLLVPLLSLGSVFYNPASAKLIHHAIPRPLLVKANSTISFFENFAKICAPFLAAVLLVYLKATQLFLLNAFSYFFSAVCVALIAPHTLSLSSHDVAEHYEASPSFPSHDRIIYYFIYSASIFSFFCGTSSILLPVYSYRVLYLTEQQFALLFTSTGVGLLLGSLIARLVQKRIYIVIGMQICLLLIGSIWISCFFKLGFSNLLVARIFEGIFVSGYVIYLRSGIYEYFPKLIIGAVFTRVIIFQSISVPAGLLCAGYLLEIYQPNFIYLASGCAIILSVLLVQTILLPSFYKEQYYCPVNS